MHRLSLHRLILFRHGKSARPAGIADHERPLAPRGREAAPLMARWLAGQVPAVDLALVSTACRTQETFAHLGADLPIRAARNEARIYEAEPRQLLEVLHELPEAVGNLMLVGHNPGMQALALGLSGGGGDDLEARSRLRRHYPTAGVAILGFDGPWKALAGGRASLIRFATPAMLGGTDED